MKEEILGFLVGCIIGFIMTFFLIASQANIASVQTKSMTCSFNGKAYKMVEVK